MNEDDDKITTVQMKVSTRNRLKKARRGDETYDDFFNRILDKIEI